MTPLSEDPWYTFRFADDQIVPQFHLEGVEAGRLVSVFKNDSQTGERLGLTEAVFFLTRDLQRVQFLFAFSSPFFRGRSREGFMRETGIWCVNFDHDEDVLAHGLDQNLWLMQYQYSHHDQTFQGGDQAGYTTRNWNQLKRVMVGHLLVAYLRPNRFFGIGRVRRPRKRMTDTDTIGRVVDERIHNFKGVVQYTDSKDLALYEDFTDSFKIRKRREWGEIESWRYNQRIDVDKWEYRVDAGVQPERSGLGEVNPNDIRCAVFPIKKQILDRIRRWLKENGGKGTL